MEKPQPTIGIAKWGAACASCSAAKSKCIRSNDTPGTKCDRCNSLQKDCLEQIHKPRKKRQRKNGNPKFEKVLASQDTLPEHYGIASKPIVNPQPLPHGQVWSSEQRRFPHRLLQSYNSLRAKSCACNGLYTEEDAIPRESDDVLLAFYVNQICDGFPFVVLPPGTNAAQLNESRPFLLQVIRMATSFRSSRSMKGQCCAILKHISEAVYVNHERSLDLLQGLLVLLASYHNLCLVHHEFNSLVQLAIAILGDLGLNHSPILPHWAKFAMRDPEEPKARSNEERRITAGVWYMSSNASMAFNKVDSARYTKYIDECLQKLQEAQEYESDELLVALVRIQQLTERIHQLNLKGQMSDDLPGIPTFPASVYFPVLQTEVERLWGSLPLKLKSNYVLNTHFDTARLRLYEVALTDRSFIYGLSGPLDQLNPSTAPALDIVHRAYMTLKKWVDNWLSVPVCYYYGMPQPLFTMLFYGITMLCRWMKSFQAQPQILEGTTPASISSINTAAAANIASLPDLASTTDGMSKVSKACDARAPVKSSLRGYVQSHPDLQLDVVAILTAMARRCEAARPEMQAAHGGLWENGTYDLAGRKLELTRDRLQWWCNITPAGNNEVSLLLKSASGEQPSDSGGEEDSDNQANHLEAQGVGKEWTEMGTGELLLDGRQGAFQWMNGLDGMSLDGGLFFDEPGDWSNVFTFDEGQL